MNIIKNFFKAGEFSHERAIEKAEKKHKKAVEKNLNRLGKEICNRMKKYGEVTISFNELKKLDSKKPLYIPFDAVSKDDCDEISKLIRFVYSDNHAVSKLLKMAAESNFSAFYDWEMTYMPSDYYNFAHYEARGIRFVKNVA